MARFPYKTQQQLQNYFMELNLDKLIQLNREYGPHFVRIEERLDETSLQLELNNQRIESLKLKREKLDEQQPFLAVQDEMYYSQREGISDTSSRSERYLAYQALSASPSEIYSSNSTELSIAYSRAVEVSQQLESQLENLKSSKSRAVEELKLLNRIIESKRQQTLGEESQLNTAFSGR